jgi:hypothetical protein
MGFYFFFIACTNVFKADMKKKPTEIANILTFKKKSLVFLALFFLNLFF